MTLPNSPDNRGIGRSISDAAGRGAVLVGIAVLIGVFLLWQGFDTDDGEAASSGDPGTTVAPVQSSTTAPPTDTGPTPTGDTTGGSTPTASVPIDEGQAHPANEVVVFVANGTGIDGEAGRLSGVLATSNYVTEPGNAAPTPVEATKIYYRPEYGPDAKLVADVLQAPDTVIQQVPEDPGVSPDHAEAADAANIIVIIGTDGAIAA